jgi:MFS family permease
MPEANRPERSPSDDRRHLSVTVVIFGLCLGATGVLFPLLAIDAGFDAATIGFLAAVSGGVQMSARVALPWLLATFEDRAIMFASYVAMAVSVGVLVGGSALALFVIAQALQGAARGLFHTASQTHSVRIPGIPTRRLAYVQTLAQFGRLGGPILGGSLAAVSRSASLWTVAGLAVAGAATCRALDVMPTYERKPPPGKSPMWRRRGVGVGCWGGAIGGVWSSVLESYVPVILAGAGLASGTIGLYVSAAEASSFGMTAVLARWGPRRIGRFIPVVAFGLAVPLVLLTLTESAPVLFGLLVITGVCGGTGSVLGSGSVTEMTPPDEQGTAIALVGLYRAGARLAAPLAVGAALAVASLPIAITGLAVALILPSTWLRRTPPAA